MANIYWQIIAYANQKGIVIGTANSHSQALEMANKALDENAHYEGITLKRIAGGKNE